MNKPRIDSPLKLGFMGDIMPGGMLEYEGGISDRVKQYLSSFDLRIATCETAFGDGDTFCSIKMTDPKLGTIIFSPDHAIEVFKSLQIDIVSIANNHIADCGYNGIIHTKELLEQNGIKCIGAGATMQETQVPLVVSIKGKKIAFLAYFMDYPYLYRCDAYTPTEHLGGINKFEYQRVISDITNCSATCDYVFVLPHWGTEQSRYPKLNEIQYSRSFIEAGATGVLGSHTHVVQPSWIYKRGIISMSLGNFLFPDRYITKPRVTCYPSKEDLTSMVIPETGGYPFVESVTLKRCGPINRLGLILDLTLNGKEISFKRQFTRLSSNHYLDLYDVTSLRYKLQDYYILLLCKDSSSILYRIHKAICRIKKMVVR